MGGGEGSSSSPVGSNGGGGGGGITEYERRRLSRIRENRARLEALGLPRLASSAAAALSPPTPFSSSPSTKQPSEKKRRRTKRRSGGDSDEDDDEEYRPSQGDHGGGDDDEVEGGDGSSSSSSPSPSSSSATEEEDEEEEEEVGGSSRGSKRKKGKKRNLSNSKKGCKRSCIKGNIEKPDDFVDEDAALEQAIALSLGGVAENSAVSGVLPRKSGTKECETGGTRKNRKLFKSRVQLSEDEVIGYFFLFDEVGKGHISVRDLQRMAFAHDFTWTDSETAAMVRLFDTDGDGKVRVWLFKKGNAQVDTSFKRISLAE